MTDRKGGNIIDTSAIDAVIRKGEDSQKAREAAMERRRKEEEEEAKKAAEEAKAEEMKKLSQDAGTSSQTLRGKGISN
jgi:hypothetical protein